MYIGNEHNRKRPAVVSDFELEDDGLLLDEGEAEDTGISSADLEKILARKGKVRFERDNLEMDERLNLYPEDIDRI